MASILNRSPVRMRLLLPLFSACMSLGILATVIKPPREVSGTIVRLRDSKSSSLDSCPQDESCGISHGEGQDANVRQESKSQGFAAPVKCVAEYRLAPRE